MKLDLTIYRKLFTFVRPYPWLTFMLLLASLCSTLSEGLGLGLILPLFDQTGVADSFLAKIPGLRTFNLSLADFSLSDRVRMAAVGLVIVILLRSLFSVVTDLLSARLQINIEHHLEKQVFQQLHEVQLAFINRQKMGDLLTHFTYHIWQIGVMLRNAINGVSNIFTLIGYALFAFFISWQLTIVAAALLFFLFVIAKQGFASQIKAAGEAETQARRRLRILTTESLNGLKLIHLFAQEGWSIQRFTQEMETYQQAAYRSKWLVSIARQILLVLAVLLMSGVLISSTILFPDQLEAWLGRMVLLLAIAFRLLTPLSALNGMNSQITNLTPALLGLLDFLRRDDKPYLPNGSRYADAFQTAITLEQVTFRYQENEEPVLRDVSFTIPKGKMTAVVGPSGAGKSSLVNLLARLYDCEAGQLCVDGINLREFDLTSWRRQIAVVSQDIFIFNDSVRANLRFARPTATDAELFEAAQLAQAHTFIMALPQQYDTLLGERGVRLSGGQQQRLAIARAILAAPQLLIFDEATSALDSETEQALQQAIEDYGRTRTLLVIAHRLSTIRRADNIIVIEAGRVVEQGSHETLMAKHGIYARLVQAQNLTETQWGAPPQNEEHGELHYAYP